MISRPFLVNKNLKKKGRISKRFSKEEFRGHYGYDSRSFFKFKRVKKRHILTWDKKPIVFYTPKFVKILSLNYTKKRLKANKLKLLKFLEARHRYDKKGVRKYKYRLKLKIKRRGIFLLKKKFLGKTLSILYTQDGNTTFVELSKDKVYLPQFFFNLYIKKYIKKFFKLKFLVFKFTKKHFEYKNRIYNKFKENLLSNKQKLKYKKKLKARRDFLKKLKNISSFTTYNYIKTLYYTKGEFSSIKTFHKPSINLKSFKYKRPMFSLEYCCLLLKNSLFRYQTKYLLLPRFRKIALLKYQLRFLKKKVSKKYLKYYYKRFKPLSFLSYQRHLHSKILKNAKKHPILKRFFFHPKTFHFITLQRPYWIKIKKRPLYYRKIRRKLRLWRMWRRHNKARRRLARINRTRKLRGQKPITYLVQKRRKRARKQFWPKGSIRYYWSILSSWSRWYNRVYLDFSSSMKYLTLLSHKSNADRILYVKNFMVHRLQLNKYKSLLINLSNLNTHSNLKTLSPKFNLKITLLFNTFVFNGKIYQPWFKLIDRSTLVFIDTINNITYHINTASISNINFFLSQGISNLNKLVLSSFIKSQRLSKYEKKLIITSKDISKINFINIYLSNRVYNKALKRFFRSFIFLKFRKLKKNKDKKMKKYIPVLKMLLLTAKRRKEYTFLNKKPCINIKGPLLKKKYSAILRNKKLIAKVSTKINKLKILLHRQDVADLNQPQWLINVLNLRNLRRLQVIHRLWFSLFKRHTLYANSLHYRTYFKKNKERYNFKLKKYSNIKFNYRNYRIWKRNNFKFNYKNRKYNIKPNYKNYNNIKANHNYKKQERNYTRTNYTRTNYKNSKQLLKKSIDKLKTKLFLKKYKKKFTPEFIAKVNKPGNLKKFKNLVNIVNLFVKKQSFIKKKQIKKSKIVFSQWKYPAEKRLFNVLFLKSKISKIKLLNFWDKKNLYLSKLINNFKISSFNRSGVLNYYEYKSFKWKFFFKRWYFTMTRWKRFMPLKRLFKKASRNFRKIEKNFIFLKLLRSNFYYMLGMTETQFLKKWFIIRRGFNNIRVHNFLAQRFSHLIQLKADSLVVFFGFSPNRFIAQEFVKCGGLRINGYVTTDINHLVYYKDMLQFNKTVYQNIQALYKKTHWLATKSRLKFVEFITINWSVMVFIISKEPCNFELPSDIFFSGRWINFYLRYLPVRISKYKRPKINWYNYSVR